MRRAPSTTQLVAIGCPASPQLLDATHSYLSSYCGASMSPATAQRFNVAIYELLANAMKYGTPGVELRVELERMDRGVALSVTNQIAPERLRALFGHIARVQRDPAAAFHEEMNRFGSGSGEHERPMLGIVRIMHECGLELSAEMEGGKVTVTAYCADSS